MEKEHQRLKENEKYFLDYQNQHPHIYDYAFITFNRISLLQKYALAPDTLYIIRLDVTYRDGTKTERYDYNGEFSAEKGKETSYLTVYYGDDDSATCHVKVYASPVNDHNLCIDLFELDIDFKNKNWTPCSNDPFYNEINVDFDYPSEYQ